MATLAVSTWIGNAAAVLCGAWGAITHQTERAGCSREVAYQHAQRVQQAVADAQLPGPSREQLLRERDQLRQENDHLRQRLAQAIDCPKAKQQQFAVTAAAMGLSLYQTLALLAIFLPRGRLPSRPTLGRWVHSHAQRAGHVLAALDQACRSLVVCLCLDEIFFRRQPVLMGIEPHSMAWLVGQRAPDRSGPTWAKALAAWPQVQDVAADGGTGLELGIDLARRARQERAAQQQTTAVPLHARLDVFHIRREGAKALRIEWQQAESYWEAAEQLERDKQRVARRGEDVRRFTFRLLQAWEKAEQALAEVDRKEKAWQRAVAALAVLRPDGQLNNRAWAAAQLAAATAELTGTRWAKTRRMLLDERALTFLDRLHEELAQAEADRERREALVALWRWQHQERKAARQSSGASWQVVRAYVAEVLRQRWGPEGQESYGRLQRVLSRVVRASSAVECVNSVVRMHQARHRKLSQELLDLKRLYWNCRSFVSGKRRGRCPYEHLGLRLSSYDPWQLLQMNPADLAQQLSTPKIAA